MNSSTCRTTMKNSTPHAISTLKRNITMPTPPSCPMRLITTNMVAKNQPQPHDMSMYSLCSFHCVHILIPSSKNVDTRQALATIGNICLPFLDTCERVFHCLLKIWCLRISSKTQKIFRWPTHQIGLVFSPGQPFILLRHFEGWSLCEKLLKSW